MARNKNQQVEYYPVNTLMNGVATSLFTALAVFFPFIMNSEKYYDITRTKKEWFFGIAIVGGLLALCALLLSYATKPSSARRVNERQVILPARKGLPEDITETFSVVRSVTAIVSAIAAAVFIIGLFTGGKLVIIAAVSLCIFVSLFAASHAVCTLGTPREESVVIKHDNVFTRLVNYLTLPDVAILLYWVCMLISCLGSDSPIESIIGLEKRNNGFWIQTLYIAVYFIISRGLIFKNIKIQLMMFAGTAISVVSILHYFGIDLYNTDYAIPRWQVEMYAVKNDRVAAGTNFLGSVGNINLLSYIIVVCLVASVLLYVVKAQPEWDKFGLFTLPCCFIMAFGERCTRTDAGIVAIIGAAFFAVVVLCNSMERLRRICIGFGTAALGWWLNVFIVKHTLQKISVDTTSKLLFCGGIMLIAVGIILTLFKDKVDNANGKIIRYGAWGVMALGAVGVCALAIVAAKTQTSGTFYEFGQILLGNFEENFGNARGKIWLNSVKLIDENPLFGIGPDRFSVIFKQELGVLFPGKNLDKAHNEYLDVLICNGIIGLGLFMTFLIGLLVRAIKHSSVCRAAGVLAVVVFAYMVHAFFGYQLPLQSPVMWAVLGLAGSACFAVNEVPVSAKGPKK